MRLKELLVNMKVGETKVFQKSRSNSVRSSVSRLKQTVGMVFHCSVSDEGLTVTRIPSDVYGAAITADILRRSGFQRGRAQWQNWEWLSDNARVSIEVKRGRLNFDIRRADGVYDRGSLSVRNIGELQNFFDLLGLNINLIV